MNEIELKFQVPPGQATAVARAVGTASARRVRLQAAYADTADRRLAAAGLALRLRREGRRWVQTLKGRGDGLMARPEHEVPVPGGAAMPAFDAARHAGTPVGDRLLALLADGAPLVVLYRTDIQRTLRRVRSGGATVELAHDRGSITAGGQRLAVDEIEFELQAGPATALVALAARWVARHGLWWDVRTKSERGFRLAEGLVQVPAPRAAPSAVAPGQAAPQALAAMLHGALAQVLPNGAEIAAGTAAPEHLHQLRVGLRRLRSVLREAAPLAGAAAAEAQALERAWAAPFGALGAARDADVLVGDLGPGIDAALAAAGLPPLAWPAAAAGDAPVPAEVLRGAEVQALLLRSLGLALAAAASDTPVPPALDRAAAAALLRPLWKRVRRGARDIAAAEPEDLHTLRKRAKRLRYLLEALAPLLPPKRLRRTLAALKPALDRLGELNDLHTARTRLAAHPEPAPSVWFALGLLAERHRHGLPVAQRALAAVFEAPPPWR
ncbi:MAG: CHAD domain-containing protein [Betaproteobacteria bacterium]|jgi:triphosphatase|nr:CYTH and CHAD domain-containing protein [Rubrivivax sp.]